MGLCLIASLASTLTIAGSILLVALGLGAVIFVHELGHFLVAKLCGVKCEKFFIGFDIGGIKLSRKWGETEYGIGVLPLGGYVKMLGQDDNPGNIVEQIEKSQAMAGSPNAKQIVGPDGETLYVDKRSYLAKSVPQRMAIISAGVIMNIIFAFVFAFWAFGIGVPIIPCVVASTTPGSPAWNVGLAPGDEITKIGDRVNPSFEDLKSNVLLGDLENGVPLEVKRAATGKTEEIVLKPEVKGKLPMIGVATAASNRLSPDLAVVEGSPADLAGDFQPGDEVIRVGDKSVTNLSDLTAVLAERAEEPLEFTVRRGGQAPEGDLFGPRVAGKEVKITVQPNPLHRLGLVMKMGPIAAIQAGSPAEAAGVRPGDVLEKVNGKSIGTAPEGEASLDPLTLPETIAQFARDRESVTLTLRRKGAASDAPSEDITIQPREVTWIESPVTFDTPMSVPALGLAYPIVAEIQSIISGSSAEEAGLQKGDQVVKAEWLNLPKSIQERTASQIEFSADKLSWPAFFVQMQTLPPRSEVKLTFQRGEQERVATLVTRPVEGAFWPERGLDFEPDKRLRVAISWSEQAELAADETISALTMVYRFLGKLWEGQIPVTAVGGPVMIANVAYFAADEGLGKLLIFLTMLSANLAVLNFLPIPLLDGGHMVFLAYEGIRGRPANERFVVAMHTIGFVCIISLMLFVFALDFGWIDRGL
ncbi:MAG: site-2 protease family protein [Pirellulales bacterium]